MPKDERLFVKMSLDYPSSLKVVGSGPAAKWLDAVGWVVSRRNMSDGIIRPSVAIAEAEVPAKAARTLIERGRWHEPGHDCEKCPQPPEGHIVIHDYPEHQQTRADLEASRQKKSDAGKKGAQVRWDGKSHGTRHGTRYSKGNGKPMAERWQEDGTAIAESEIEIDATAKSVSHLQSVRRELDDDGLTRIRQALNNCPEKHARECARFVLAKAPTDVRNPVAYVLAAIREEPDAYRYRRGNPKKGEECPEHAGQWADACAGCAADRKASA